MQNAHLVKFPFTLVDFTQTIFIARLPPQALPYKIKTPLKNSLITERKKRLPIYKTSAKIRNRI